MTVGELIRELQNFDESDEVIIETNKRLYNNIHDIEEDELDYMVYIKIN